MKTIVLISCVSKKLPYPAQAQHLYNSSLFKGNLEYAHTYHPDEIYILSAKYGVVKLDQEIAPYNLTLNEMGVADRKKWAERVLGQLRTVANLEEDKFIFLAGERYRQFLIPEIKHFEVPLEGKSIGKQLQFLKGETSKVSTGCERLHQRFNSMIRFRYPFDQKVIPMNGIYILFEKGEKGHGQDRIVRIGTHTGNNQLPSRLQQHFFKENKDRSIFRKNIGRALLAKANDPFLKEWELDLTTNEAKIKNKGAVDPAKLESVEKQVSEYMRNNFSFVFFPITDKDKRLLLESRIISTVSHCKDCGPSQTWLGLSSPKDKIRESGLWLVNELYKESFSEEELKEFFEGWS